MKLRFTKITEKPLFLAESALWDEKRKSWFYVDIFDGTLYQYEALCGSTKSWSFGVITSAVVLGSDSSLILIRQDGIGLFDPESGIFTNKVHPNRGMDTVTRYNDCKCDPSGRLYAGTMDLAGRPGVGRLYLVRPDWSWEIALDAVDYSNGILWNKEGTQVYYTDTYSGNVFTYDCDPATGRLSGRRILCTFPPGQPDGMTQDESGRLIIALWGGSGAAIVDSKNGSLLDRIDLEVPNVSSVCFGGLSGTDLLVTTARKDLSAEELAQHPAAGSVYLAESTGIKSPGFYPMRLSERPKEPEH